MSSFILASLPTATKLFLTAVIVTTAATATERAGPLAGAVIVTLPVTTWPAYLFIYLDQGPSFAAASALSGLAMVAVNITFMLSYVMLAQRVGMLPSLAGAVAVWIFAGATAQQIEWSFGGALLVDLIVFVLALQYARRYCDATVPATARRWYDIPLRAFVVCMFMATILLLARYASAAVTGMAAVFPASSASAVLILHPRLGGRATAAMVANGIRCHAGIAGLTASLYLAIEPLGAAAAFSTALAIPVAWNAAVWTACGRWSLWSRS
jgi:hypothetical protein